MGNSSLVDIIRISPNSMGRGSKVDTIVIHMMSNNQSIEACAAYFAVRKAKASATYVIGSDGRVGLCVDESRRPMTSNSWKVDDKAITIEVANDTGKPDYHVSDKAMEKLILLCADVCKRHGFRLNFTGDMTGNLLMHKWIAPGTSCPGPFLESQFPAIADAVNKLLTEQGDNNERDQIWEPAHLQ